jgi:hypothetical protein
MGDDVSGIVSGDWIMKTSVTSDGPRYFVLNNYCTRLRQIALR